MCFQGRRRGRGDGDERRREVKTSLSLLKEKRPSLALIMNTKGNIS